MLSNSGCHDGRKASQYGCDLRFSPVIPNFVGRKLDEIQIWELLLQQQQSLPI
jgi:hypothetical protein